NGSVSIGNYMVVFPNPTPRLDLINVATTNIAEGSGPVTMVLPNGSSTNQPVTVQARNFNTSVPIQVTIAPQNGPTVIYTNTILNASSNPASVTLTVTVPVSTPVTVSAWSKVP